MQIDKNEKNKDEVREAFMHFAEQDGFIKNFNKLPELAQALDIQVSANEFKKVFNKFILGGQNNINFEQFYLWYKARMQNVEPLSQIALGIEQAIMKSQQFEGQLNQFNQYQGAQQQQNSLHDFKISAGNNNNGTRVTLKILQGKLQEDFAQKLCQGFNNINSQTPSIIFSFGLNQEVNSEEAKNALQELVNELIENFSVMLPDQMQQIFEKLAFEYTVHNHQTLTMGIKVELDYLNIIVEKYLQLINTISQNQNLSGNSIQLDLASSFTLQNLLENKTTPFSEIVDQDENSGIEMNLKLQLDQSLLEKLKHMIRTQMEKEKQKSEQGFKQLLRKMGNAMATAFLLNSTNFHLSFKSLYNLLSHGEGKIDFPPEFQESLQSFKQDMQLEGMADSIPGLEQILNFGKKYLSRNLSFIIQFPKVSLVIDFQTNGFSDFVDYFLNSEENQK